MPTDPELLRRAQLIADKPLAQCTLRDVLTISELMDAEPTAEELTGIGLPAYLLKS